jgi:hypothetical protein
LSNADLITTVSRSFQHAGISSIILTEGIQALKYKDYAHNLLNFIRVQSLGFPTYNHGLFTNYNIEAVTISGTTTIKGRKLNLTNMAL